MLEPLRSVYSRLPLAQREAIAQRRRALRRSAETRAARGVARFLSALPRAVAIRAKESTNFRVRLDYAPTHIELHAESMVEYETRARSCVKEPETVGWIEEHLLDNDVFYDIGANIGAYSLVAAAVRPKASVFAFEPSFANFAQLSRNVLLNGANEIITPVHIALSDHTGIVSLHLSSVSPGAADHGVADDFAGGLSIKVPAVSMDDLASQLGFPPPTIVKLDVDGVEFAILQGGERCLGAVRTILVEMNPGREGEETLPAWLGARGFDLASRYPHGPTGSPYNSIYIRRA